MGSGEEEARSAATMTSPSAARRRLTVVYEASRRAKDPVKERPMATRAVSDDESRRDQAREGCWAGGTKRFVLG